MCTYAVYVVSNVASECVMYHVSIMYLQYLPSFCILSMHGVNHFDHSSFLGNVSNPIIPSTFVFPQKWTMFSDPKLRCSRHVETHKSMYPNNKWATPHLGSFTSPCMNDTWRDAPQPGPYRCVEFTSNDHSDDVSLGRKSDIFPIQIFMFHNH